ncbi:MAG: aspartate carbamoyltransferase catalytic subunit [Candidatus Aminicenantia bacterium]
MRDNFKRKHLLGIEELEKSEIELILEEAKSFSEISLREIKKVPTLRGKTVINLFFEPSTRTRSSFEIAAKRLSADIINFSASTSSLLKGETLKDTVRNLEAMRSDIIVVRHPSSYAPHFIATFSKSSVVNAGDGTHEHPTQALLDAFTILERRGKIDGLKIVIAGDILHSRVARSNIFLLTKLGANIFLSGPPTLVPKEMEKLGVKVEHDFDRAVEDADVIMMLRIQLERMTKNFFPSLREYRMLYSLNLKRLKRAKKDVIIMHPGPINRGIELSSEIADSDYSVILDQVANGIALRMAVLYLLSVARET